MPGRSRGQRSRPTHARRYADISGAVPGSRTRGIVSDRIRPGIVTAPDGQSAPSAFGLGLERFRKDDGGAGRGAPAQGPEEVFGPDQAALVDLVQRIPSQELDAGPEAGLVVAPGSSRVVRIVNALAADVAALDNARTTGSDDSQLWRVDPVLGALVSERCRLSPVRAVCVVAHGV